MINFIIYILFTRYGNGFSVWDESPSVSSKGQWPYTQSLFFLGGAKP